MLEHLSRCVGIENYTIIASVEPICEEVIELLRGIDFCEKTVHVNDERLTCNLNTMKAMYLGFQKSKHILHIEDDVILGKDALTIYEENINNKHFSFGLYSKIYPETYTDSQFYRVMERDTFVPWGFGISEQAFLRALEWNCFCPDICHYLSWDCRIDAKCKQNKLIHGFPFLSRTNNIGAVGTHIPSAEWHRENQHLDFWVETL